MNDIKRLVDKLHLEQFYNNFIREDYSYKYYIEIYAYKVNYNDNDVIYIGNRTIPKNVCNEYTEIKYREAEYWLNGNSDTYFILHRYDCTCNMTGYEETHDFNKLGNQKVLNSIKQYIIDNLNTNFNVMIMPKNYDIFNQIGKQIYDWKNNIKKEIKNYSLNEFIEDFKNILYMIKNNALYWHKYLILKNRFWFISINNNDVIERNNINFNEMTIPQKVIVIVMKEWLAMIVNQSHLNFNYNMHIDKVIYKLENIHFKNEELFNNSKVSLFNHKTAIKLLLSTMYNNSSPKQIEDIYSKFMNWRRNYVINIFNNG